MDTSPSQSANQQFTQSRPWPAISIIVPVYKVERYLPKCLDSIQAQVYRNFECLLIDDGSPDSSGKICDDYANRDSRFLVFHQLNGGVSKARNLGLIQARGKWVTFVDSDDYIAKDYLSTFMDSQCPEDALVVLSSISILSDGTNHPGYSFDDVKITKAEGKLLCQNLTRLRSSWGKFYSRHLLIKNKIFFPEDIHLGEDIFFYTTISC